jgi:hypothetical protein
MSYGSIDIGMNETLEIRDDPAGPYFILWPFGNGPFTGSVYRVHVEKTERGWRIAVPALPGFVGEGDTREAAEAALIFEIKAYLYRLKGFLDRTTPLVPRYIAPDPVHPGEANVIVQPEGVSVWAVIGSMQAASPSNDRPGYFDRFIGDSVIRETAADYGIPEDAVRAAVAYYYRHKAAIDTQIDANSVVV